MPVTKRPFLCCHSHVSLSIPELTWHTALTRQSADKGAKIAAGPGAFDFQQGDDNGTLFWKVVRSFIHLPSKAQNECHAPKPILLDTGNINFPYPW